MTELMRQWLLGVTCGAMVLALAESLTPEGGPRRVCRLAGGLVLLLAAVSPVLRLNEDLLAQTAAAARPDGARYEQALEERNEMIYKTIIAEETAAYISDKAERLGIDCRAEVTLEYDAEGQPYPYAVSVWGSWTEEQRSRLSEAIEADLGIPAGRQRFEGTEP